MMNETELAVMKQALKALERHEHSFRSQHGLLLELKAPTFVELHQVAVSAIAALRDVLGQQSTPKPVSEERKRFEDAWRGSLCQLGLAFTDATKELAWTVWEVAAAQAEGEKR